MFQSLFDLQARLDKIDQNGDTLAKINRLMDWEIFREPLQSLEAKKHESKAGRKPYDRLLLFKMLIIQSLYNLSDDQLEQQTLDRLSFHRFLGLSMGDPVPDSKTIWLFRESLNADDKARQLFDQFNQHLNQNGLSARQGQMVDATIVRVPIQRNSHDENEAIKNGLAEEVKRNWPKAKSSQKDTDARWTKKHNKTYFGYKNHISADVKGKIIRNYTVTSAEGHDSKEFDHVLDENNSSRDVYADSAYLSKEHLKGLKNRKFREHINRKGYKNKPLTEKQKDANKNKSKIRSRVEHVFGAMKQMAGNLTLRTIGLVRAVTKIGLRNLVYNIARVAYLFPKIRDQRLIR